MNTLYALEAGSGLAAGTVDLPIAISTAWFLYLSAVGIACVVLWFVGRIADTPADPPKPASRPGVGGLDKAA